MVHRFLQVVAAGIALAAIAGQAQETAPVLDKVDDRFVSIAGPLPKTVKAGTYRVIADIEVPRNRIVTIEAGAVFLFRNFTSLHVQGTLAALGTKAKPVVFTSEYDKAYNPESPQDANPFDWDGVYIHADALSTRLLHCKVLYSVYGLISETKFIRIDPGTFLFNGKGNVVVDNKDLPESGPKDSGEYRYVLSTKDATIDGVAVKLLDDPLAPKRNWTRWGGLSVLLGGVGATVYQAMEISDNADNLRALSRREESNLNQNSSAEWQQANDYLYRDIYLTIPAALVTVLGAVGFSWSFTF